MLITLKSYNHDFEIINYNGSDVMYINIYKIVR